MSEAIPKLARQCRDREFLSGVFEGYIEHEHENITLGQSDLALMERTLGLLEDDQDLLVVNPFSYPMVPALICAAYMLGSDTRVNSVDESTSGLPLLLFPKEGYIGDIEGFNYRDIVSDDGLLNKTNVGSPSDFEQDHVVNRVTDESVLQASGLDIGLMFVDLRKDLWKNNIPEYERFAQENDVRSLLFYADERDYATEAVDDMVNDDLEIDRSVIAEATTDTYDEGASRAHKQEYILTEGVDVSITSIDIGDLEDQFDELYRKRKAIEEVVPDLHAVSDIHNTLLELAVEPSVYDEQVRGNFYYSSTQQLVERLEEFVSRADETVAGRIDEYWRLAAGLREQLEQDNPKQNVFFERVEEANQGFEPTTFVARNRMHRDALEQGIFLEGIELRSHVEVVAKNEVDPQPQRKHIFVNLPGYRHSLYEFPPSEEVEFLTYPFLTGIVQDEVSGATDRGPTESGGETTVSIDNNQEIGRRKTVSLDASEIESDISGSLSVEIESNNSNAAVREAPEDDEVQIEFTTGESRTVGRNSMMTTLEREDETVRRKRARRLVPGDKVVVMDDAATDLYETITQHQHEKRSIQQRELLVERWREILEEALKEEFTSEEMLQEIQEMGSDISSTSVIESWADGTTFGPRDPKDVRRVLAVARPGSEGSAEEIVEAIKYIRALHRRIGRRVKRLVEAEIDPTRKASFESGIGEQLNQIEDKIDIKDVSNTSAV